MQRRNGGQSLIEMAFILPLLLFIIFGIIDFSYYIFSYATVSNAVRNGAEVAAQMPPRESWLAYADNPPPDADWAELGGFRADDCTNTILSAVEDQALMFQPDISGDVTISYPSDTTPTVYDDQTRNLAVRGPIEVSIVYQVPLLTPLPGLFSIGENGTVTIDVTARRSLENLGANPDSPNGIACVADIAAARQMRDWRDQQ